MPDLDQAQKDHLIVGMLKVINQARSALGGEALGCLPLGTPGDPDDCSGQRALRDLLPGCSVADGDEVLKISGFANRRAFTVIAAVWGEGRSEHGVYLPPAFCEFIDAFDGLQLPELIDPATLFPRADDWPEDKTSAYDAAIAWMKQHGLVTAVDRESGAEQMTTTKSATPAHGCTAIIHAKTAAQILAERDQAGAEEHQSRPELVGV